MSEEAETFSDNLVALCREMNFDGFLINFECTLTPVETAVLIDWIVMTRNRLKSCISHGMLVWYDAVTIEGKLNWQNALNLMNKPFFDVCDAIFLNYAWDQSAAADSASVAGDRICDLFLGVDVFGRGTFAGGKFNSHLASAVSQVCRQPCSFDIHLAVPFELM